MAFLAIALAVVSDVSAQGRTVNIWGAGCASCEVVFEPVVTLGASEGPAMLEADSHSVERDSHGRFFVFGSGPSYFWVFDEKGSLVQRVGREGQGPGEFGWIDEIAIDAMDSVFVFDGLQGRVTVYSPELELVRTENLGRGSAGEVAFVGPDLVVNVRVRTPERIGLPLHVLTTDGEILRSFGSTTDGLYRPDMRLAIYGRHIAVADDRTILSAWINQYRIERWDPRTGRLLETFLRSAQWLPAWWDPDSSAETPPEPLMDAIEQRGDTLWLIGKIADPQWRDAVEPSGRLFRVTDRDGYRDTVIEAVDVRTGELLLTARLPQMIDDFIGGGLVLRNETDQFGNPQVVVGVLRVMSSTPRR